MNRPALIQVETTLRLVEEPQEKPQQRSRKRPLSVSVRLLRKASLIDQQIAWCILLRINKIPGNGRGLSEDHYPEITKLTASLRKLREERLREKRTILQRQIEKALK